MSDGADSAQQAWDSPLLIVAVDAELRQRMFEQLARAGYRVDGVGAGPAAEKRLAKDRYAAIVVASTDRALISGTTIPIVEVDSDLADLAGRVRHAIDLRDDS
ncbi:MAG: hypothetical protein AAF581_01105 [Planctomycetota bacterium]